MIFKCEACDSWNKGEGAAPCLKCVKYRFVGRENFKVEVEYYADYEQFASPGDWESLYPAARKQDIWHKINNLDWREATMLTQYYFLEMTQENIAEYHGMARTTVMNIIKRTLEKLKDI